MTEKIKVLVYKPDEQGKVININNDLESFQRLVDGYIKVIRPFTGECDEALKSVLLICNEEGKEMCFPKNRFLIGSNGELRDLIVGNFVLCRKAGEEFASLSEKQIKLAMQRISAKRINYLQEHE